MVREDNSQRTYQTDGMRADDVDGEPTRRQRVCGTFAGSLNCPLGHTGAQQVRHDQDETEYSD